MIWGAGLDVFENEPTLAPGLAELDNVVVVPHIASATAETRHKMGQIAVGNVVSVLGGKPPQTCVSPEVLRGCVQSALSELGEVGFARSCSTNGAGAC